MVLRRSVGVATATATSAGLAFAAIDYLGVVSVLAYAPGATAALAIVIGGILVLLIAGIFSELNGLYPTAAGIRLYLGRAVGNRTALSVTFTYMTTVVLVIAADAFLIGAAVRHVLHEPAALAYVWIAVLLGIALAANLRGVRLAGWMQTLVTYTVLARDRGALDHRPVPRRRRLPPPLQPVRQGHLLGGPGVGLRPVPLRGFRVGHDHRRGGPDTAGDHPGSVHRSVPDLARGDAVRSRADAPGAVLASSTTAPIPQLLMGKAALGTVGEIWMLALTVLTALNTFNGGFLVASRFIYAAAREGNLPRQFARLNLNAVPWLAVTTLAGVSAVVAAVVFATGQWLLLVAVGAAIEAGIYALGLALPPDPAQPRDPRAALPADRRPSAGGLRRRPVQRPLSRDGLLRPDAMPTLLGGPDRGDRGAGVVVHRLRAGLRAAAACCGDHPGGDQSPAPPAAPARHRGGGPVAAAAVPSSAVGRVPLKSDVGDLLPRADPRDTGVCSRSGQVLRLVGRTTPSRSFVVTPVCGAN